MVTWYLFVLILDDMTWQVGRWRPPTHVWYTWPATLPTVVGHSHHSLSSRGLSVMPRVCGNHGNSRKAPQRQRQNPSRIFDKSAHREVYDNSAQSVSCDHNSYSVLIFSEKLLFQLKNCYYVVRPFENKVLNIKPKQLVFSLIVRTLFSKRLTT